MWALAAAYADKTFNNDPNEVSSCKEFRQTGLY
jgi:hypothetical protein